MASTTKVTRLYDFVNGTASDADKVDAELNQLVTQENNTVDDITSLQSQITALTATTDGASGADSIGATAITSLSGTTVQAILESLRNSLKSVVDGSSGADFVAATAVTDLSGATVQAILESLRDKLKDATDSQSGADFVAATAISGLTGATIQALLESLKTYIDTHKSSSDHDSRYYTETEMNAGQMDSRYYTESEIADATSTSASGAKKVGVKSTYGATVQDWITYLDTYGVAVGGSTIPADASVTPAKLNTTLYNDIYSPTYSTETEVTQEITSLASTVLNGKLTAEVQGNTVVNILSDNVAGCESNTGWTASSGSIATDSSNEIEGTNCLKPVLGGSSDTYDYDILSMLASGRYYLLSGYVKNGNATNIKLGLETDDQDISTSVVTATSYNRVGVVIAPTDFDTASSAVMRITVTGSVGQYGYFDALMLQEITSTEYALGASALLTKYAYHRGTKSTDRIAVKSVGKNLFDKSKREIGYYITEATGVLGSSTISDTSAYIKVEPSTTYYLSGHANRSTQAMCWFDENKTHISGTTSTNGTKTSPSNAEYARIAVAKVDIDTFQFEKGSTATSYVPHTSTTAILPNELKRISSSIYDVWDANLGKHTKNISDWVTLSGNAYATWSLNVDGTGAKQIYPSTTFSDMGTTYSSTLILKYNGKKLGFADNASTPDYFIAAGDKKPYITIADTDSGWDEAWINGTSFTGMTLVGLIKAYMNGWKLTTANTNVASCVWTGIASGTTQSGASGYSHVIANIDTGFTPYKMIYQLATHVVTNYYPNILTAEPSGTIYVEPFVSDFDFYDSGCVVTNVTYPISSLAYVNIVNKVDGSLTPVALSTCTVASDGLSFTSTGISAEDLVDFGYNHLYLSTGGTLVYSCDENLKATVVSNREDIGELDRKIEQVITQEKTRLSVATVTMGAISATTTFCAFVAPTACDLVDIKLVTKDAIAASDTNYWTIEAIDKGSAGSDSNVIVSKTTKVTGGTAVAAYDAYDLGALDTTHSKLAAGDVVLLTFTKSASATAFAEAMAMITYIAGN